MSFGDAMQLIQTLLIALAGGLALLQLRQSERNRERNAALQILSSFQTPAFSRGAALLFGIPDGLDKAALEAHVGARMGELYILLHTLESIGVLVYRREISIEMVEDFLGGIIVLTWHKCGPYLEAVRHETGRDTIAEWVQWLAERFAERERTRAPVPAFIAHRDWRPNRQRAA